jgi:hypothetical protein
MTIGDGVGRCGFACDVEFDRLGTHVEVAWDWPANFGIVAATPSVDSHGKPPNPRPVELRMVARAQKSSLSTAVSELPEGQQRFLSQVIEHGLSIGLRAPEDFLEHFPPRAIMLALAGEAEIRARILQETVGLRERIALRKSPESSGEDLQIALDEDVTDAATVVSLLHPDERVRHLENRALWSYVMAARPWLETREGPRLERVREHTAFILRVALDEELVTARDVVSAISVPTLVQYLPREDVSGLLERALLGGRLGDAFTDDALVQALGVQTLAKYIPLPTLWEWVIETKIAIPLGLASEDASAFDDDDGEEEPVDVSQEVTVIIDPTSTETVPGTG